MIHTLTLNPAIDRILYMDKLDKNVTNRIKKSVDTIGGKGTHVSINLKILGQPSYAFGICHGQTGRRVIEMLDSYGINTAFCHYCDGGKETRTNYLLIEDSTDCTIIAETGVKLNPRELEHLLQAMSDIIGTDDYLILSGDASNSPDPSVYNKILKSFKKQNLKVFLDTSGASLRECILESPFMIKPNLDELSELTGQFIAQDDTSIINAILSLDRYSIGIIAVSLGGDGSIVKTPDGIYRVYPPKVHVCNTIGCGDSYLAGFAYGLCQNLSTEDTIRTASAVSAATAESSLSAGFDPKRADQLKEQVTIVKLS